ncbi:hypothetical protein F4780DRAFT_785162 [Xylariomycetidae sp. FL0641]|nr:hypothetical protein F4780DRAFT_785162 [Xylariomycetidae sp. FL0641]
MSCGGRRKVAEIRPEQKWEAISLQDFKSNSFFTPFAYGYLYFSLLISMAVYGVDSFTAINLLAFDTWSGSIEPTQLISFDVSKWIFSACIIASFVNLAFEHLRAWRVMRRGSVAESYLDNLAVRLESVRITGGQGWRRFLVFAELTKSKKGAEYVALFTYFSFQSWFRVIFCSGPRQVVNALTLYAVYKSNLIPTDVSSVQSTLGSFFAKLQTLAAENMQQAVILSGMVFTLVIWVISVLFFLVACLFYVFFLWHYIPRQDGGLRGYCERKINKRLVKIVTVKVNDALANEEKQRRKADYKAALKTGEKPVGERQATLPKFLDAGMDSGSGNKLQEMPMMSRTETMATLPVYTSRPGTPSEAFDPARPPPPSRRGTDYSANTSLVSSAAGMGMDRAASPVPSLPNIDFSGYQQPPPRPGTANSNRSYGPAANPSLFSQDAMPPMPERVMSPASTVGGFSRPMPSPAPTMDGYARPMPRAVNQLSGRPGPPGTPGPPGRPPFEGGMRDGRSSPAPSMYSNRGPPPPGSGYAPVRSATGPSPMFTPPQRQQFTPQPQRNMTAPMPPRQGGDPYAPRPGTGPGQRNMGPGYGYNVDIESQRGYPRY